MLVLEIPYLSNLLPLLGAGALAFVAYVLGDRFAPRFHRPQTARLTNFVITRSAAKAVPVGSFEHRVRIAFSGVRMDASGREEFYLMLARLGAGAVMVLLLLIMGLPLLTSLAGFAAGYVFVNGWVTRAWNKTRTEIEAELPSLLTRLASVIQTAPNVPSALETVAQTLRSDGPLRAWTQETAARMHREGYAVMDAVREGAAGISTSLSIAADLIGRMWTTGGEGYVKAFAAAADNLESVLDARVLARAKGSSAQGTVNILTGMTFLMIGFMTHSAALADSVRSPLVQIAYAIIILAIVFGHSQVSDLIDNAV